MARYFGVDEWRIIEDRLDAETNRISESIFSLGNGHMGMRGNFEEPYSGDTHPGTYIAGVYYPDDTKVGWWKVGYPEHQTKVINAPSFIGVGIRVDGEAIDLGSQDVVEFRRELDMRQAVLSRAFTVAGAKGRKVRVETRRFLSMDELEIAAVEVSVTPLDAAGDVELAPQLTGDVRNEDANSPQPFWDQLARSADGMSASLTMRTKRSGFDVAEAMRCELLRDGEPTTPDSVETIDRELIAGARVKIRCEPGQAVTLRKYVAVTTSRDYEPERVADAAGERVESAAAKGFDALLDAHAAAWERIWDHSDIVIEGDTEAQQGIRFNILQLYQTYHGHDPRLNIGPKGFTGEKYSGSTWWDTEAYCLPFFLSTADPAVARNLLIYRHRHLPKARENAARLGVGGALYPMVTLTGEECHNEWEITFEEIHRNAAIAYAIFNTVRYTGDASYLPEKGFEVLAGICRFWASRCVFNERAGKYMILGVTGPNEYENNVNNNWYTNRMAAWCMEYTLEVMDFLRREHPDRLQELSDSLGLSDEEIAKWNDVAERMYYPSAEGLDIFAQQDGYMDKEQTLVADLPDEDLPLNQNWSWDRILRSCFIKQADVMQGIFFLNDRYDRATKKRNFDFYEPRTVHESSLSPCVYSILASELGYGRKAYELYLRTARLDLDNYNNDTDDGLHITSMAGTWMSIVYGFGQMRIRNDRLQLSPAIPSEWKRYSFKIVFRGHLLKVTVQAGAVDIDHQGDQPLTIGLFGQDQALPAGKTRTFETS